MGGVIDFQAQSSLITVRGVSKHFRGQYALRDIDIDIAAGTVHALVGENGAGKSTLGKLIAGVHQSDRGVVCLDGSPVQYRSPADALADGISIIAQEIALAPDLTVMGNVLLGREASVAGTLSRRAMRREFDALCERTGLHVPAGVRAGDLPLAQQQEVEILRSLSRNARVLVMDEPTAALTAGEAEKLREYVRRLRDEGVTILYVSHFLDDVLALADEITVMRNGRVVETVPRADASTDRLMVGMLGKKLEAMFPDRRPAAPDAAVALSVHGLVVRAERPPLDCEVRKGEILGLFGLMGAGRSSLAHSIAGSHAPVSGRVELAGVRQNARGPRNAIDRGLVLLPESRRDQGLFLSLSQLANAGAASLGKFTAGGVVRRGVQKTAIASMLQSLKVDPLKLSGEVGDLSGGNQQKVLFAKCLMCSPEVLILDEPTRGVDVGAKQGIYELVVDLAAGGMAVLLISSELDEVLQLSHRLLVMRDGAVVRQLDSKSAGSEAVLSAAFGVTGQTSPSNEESRA